MRTDFRFFFSRSKSVDNFFFHRLVSLLELNRQVTFSSPSFPFPFLFCTTWPRAQAVLRAPRKWQECHRSTCRFERRSTCSTCYGLGDGTNSKTERDASIGQGKPSGTLMIMLRRRRCDLLLLQKRLAKLTKNFSFCNMKELGDSIRSIGHCRR